ncbi:hypothetical protein STEG23_019519, partial [Scotinomys teguina]
MLFGQGQYATIAAQINYDPAVHAQIGAAVVRAWKALPNKAAGDQLSKVVQGFSEPYSEFVSHLIQLAGKIFGDADTATPVIKQLAFENANKYCKEALRAHKDKSLNDMIRLCRDIDVNHITGQVLVAAIRQGFGRSSVDLRGLVITPGIVDADYEGEIKVLTSAQNGVIVIPEGESLAQMILIPIMPTSNPSLEGHCGTKPFGSTRSLEVFCVTDMKECPKLTLNVDGKQFYGILDTGADMSVLSMEHGPKDAEKPVWLLEHCMHPVDAPADIKDNADDPDSTNIGTGAMGV